MRKIVIVGGVAGGATTATRLRRLDETTEIVMIERGEHISFANCGLPYHIGEVIQEREDLILQTADKMSKQLNIAVKNLSEAIAINEKVKTITIKDLKTGETYEESYDTLVLSTGAKPIIPEIKGLETAKNVFTLRNIPDMDRIKAYLSEKQIKKAAILGGGFIGVEMAENLVALGLEVTLMEKSDQVLAPLDPEMATIVHKRLTKSGVKLELGNPVTAIEDNGHRLMLEDGTAVETDLMILAIGVTPENDLAKTAGLTLGVKGTVVVDGRFKTSEPDIYAIGDLIQVRDYVTGESAMIPLAWPANRQGRLLADHLNGKHVNYEGTLGTAIVKVFDLTVATTGTNEKALRASGFPYHVVHAYPKSHAGYYPEAKRLAMKLIFDHEGVLFGAQIIGEKGVDKRIDVLSTAIKGGLTIYELQDLELAYAPPYSSAKDPVNMLGYLAANVLEREVCTYQWHEVEALISEKVFLLDVRNPEEVQRGTLPTAVNIPLGELRERLNELPKDRNIHVFCQVGLRGYAATRILMGRGIMAYNLDGGYQTYLNGAGVI